MEPEVINRTALFGIEVEFFILDHDGFPVLNSYNCIKNEIIEMDPTLSIECETSSFQIEINPGPWPLNAGGLDKCVEKLNHHYSIIKRVVESYDFQLCTTLVPTKISQSIINNPDFTTKNPRYHAFSEYFKNNEDVVLQNKSEKLVFPGETILGCINEIHIHAQLSNDENTLNLFNHLNSNGLELTKNYNQAIEINNCVFDNINSLKLFELANGEWNSDGTIYRVGNIPNEITSYYDYLKILESFNEIPINCHKSLDRGSTVYFWTRLRGNNSNLRVEFRPMEMGPNWLERVKYLYKIIKDFEEN